jgi:hypothetical protein
MKKSLVVASFFFVLLLVVSFTLTYKSNDGTNIYSEKGWPVAYQKEINNHGLCIGYSNALPTPLNGKGCYISNFSTNKYAVEVDTISALAASLVISLLLTRLLVKKTK